MDSNYLIRPLVFLIQAGFGIYILIVMLRFLLQALQADFHNPVSQFVIKATAPLLNPLRKVIPAIRGYDTSSLILAWALKALELSIIGALIGAAAFPAAILWAIPALVSLVINIFLFSILIVVILSWINPQGYSPALVILHRLTAPLLAPVRRMIPSIGGLDLSPMVVMIGLYVVQMLVVPPLRHLTGAPAWVSLI